MPSTTLKTIYFQAFRDGMPFILVVCPFAFLFGVVATEAGLDVLSTFFFSALVIAGAAQFAAVQLMTENAPAFAVVLTALAVNLRMAMYSASLATHIGQAPLLTRAFVAYLNVDQSYAMSALKYEQSPDMTLTEKVVYFFGVVSPVAPLWYVFSLLGALLGDRLPTNIPIDFAVPITFIAVIAPMLKSLAHVGAAVTSVILALGLIWMPFGSGLLIAGVGAMIVGAEIERRGGGPA